MWRAGTLAEFLELAARIPIRPEVQEFPLADANMALQELKNRKIRGAKVLRVRVIEIPSHLRTSRLETIAENPRHLTPQREAFHMRPHSGPFGFGRLAILPVLGTLLFLALATSPAPLSAQHAEAAMTQAHHPALKATTGSGEPTSSWRPASPPIRWAASPTALR